MLLIQQSGFTFLKAKELQIIFLIFMVTHSRSLWPAHHFRSCRKYIDLDTLPLLTWMIGARILLSHSFYGSFWGLGCTLQATGLSKHEIVIKILH